MPYISTKKKTKNTFTSIPYVIEKNTYNENTYDIYSRLLKDRIIFLTGEINDNSSNLIIAQMLFLEAKNPNQDIFLYINSPGGIVTSGLSIYDTMQFIQPDINTICLGQACSMAALLLCSGTFGKRFCLPNSRIMLHQPSGGFQGQASDIMIQAQEIKKIKKKINTLIAFHTKNNIKKIKKDTNRDYFLSPKESLQYGIIDSIFTTRKK
ncbi:ATP-dependent Clp protease proteolytic subunit [Buchnera aphidicola]|uniref:ATP-dependent Clp protease proteolytic subunit n=1 Tax=Buchnera aphidicola TaxID=9 RepID=UPI0031B73B16